LVPEEGTAGLTCLGYTESRGRQAV